IIGYGFRSDKNNASYARSANGSQERGRLAHAGVVRVEQKRMGRLSTQDFRYFAASVSLMQAQARTTPAIVWQGHGKVYRLFHLHAEASRSLCDEFIFPVFRIGIEDSSLHILGGDILSSIQGAVPRIQPPVERLPQYFGSEQAQHLVERQPQFS